MLDNKKIKLLFDEQLKKILKVNLKPYNYFNVLL